MAVGQKYRKTSKKTAKKETKTQKRKNINKHSRKNYKVKGKMKRKWLCPWPFRWWEGDLKDVFGLAASPESASQRLSVVFSLFFFGNCFLLIAEVIA